MVGLVYDNCVVDSAVNAAVCVLFHCEDDDDDVMNNSVSVFIVVDGSRGGHIPGVGLYGSGFLTNPCDVINMCKKA